MTTEEGKGNIRMLAKFRQGDVILAWNAVDERRRIDGVSAVARFTIDPMMMMMASPF